mmetsp:Transcript_127919/g.409794  ORF Transcript_127919/g.409794 Transcript_127919/m.409794 type:complete len:220 (+) Transcript_127919:260-919(+)
MAVGCDLEHDLECHRPVVTAELRVVYLVALLRQFEGHAVGQGVRRPEQNAVRASGEAESPEVVLLVHQAILSQLFLAHIREVRSVELVALRASLVVHLILARIAGGLLRSRGRIRIVEGRVVDHTTRRASHALARDDVANSQREGQLLGACQATVAATCSARRRPHGGRAGATSHVVQELVRHGQVMNDLVVCNLVPPARRQAELVLDGLLHVVVAQNF